MKRFLSLILCCGMILSLSVFASAEHYGDWNNDLDREDYFKVGDQAYSYEDFLDFKFDGKTLIPGNSYYFEAQWEGRPLTKDFFDFYKISLNVGTAFPSSQYGSGERREMDEYLSSHDAEKLVEKIEMTEMDGKYYLHLKLKNYFPHRTEKTIKVYAIAEDKANTKIRSRADLEIDIGYDKNTLSGSSTVNSSEFRVDNDEPVVEFDEELTYCRIELEDDSIFEAKFEGKKNTEVNLVHSNDGDLALKNANPKANLKFLNFPGRPHFLLSGRLLIKAPGMNYAYEISQDGSLTQVGAKPSDGFIGVITDNLTSYVVSDIPLKGAENVNPSVPSNPSVNIPYNPGTGAAA